MKKSSIERKKRFLSMWDRKLIKQRSLAKVKRNFIAENAMQVSSVDEKFDREVRKRFVNISQMVSLMKIQRKFKINRA